LSWRRKEDSVTRDRDPWEDPGTKKWASRVLRELVPMIQHSAFTVSIVPEVVGDVKFAVELGFSIMLGKPIILAVRPGTTVPEKLVKVADEIVEMDSPDDPESMVRLYDAIDRVRERLDME
jgi:hypothetical protein